MTKADHNNDDHAQIACHKPSTAAVGPTKKGESIGDERKRSRPLPPTYLTRSEYLQFDLPFTIWLYISSGICAAGATMHEKLQVQAALCHEQLRFRPYNTSH